MTQAPFDNIVQHLFHQPSLHSVTVDELENMAQQHPYFAAAHFLLLKKMQDTGHPDFTAQLQKTTIYFNNPLWLQFLLQPEAVSNFTVSEKSPFITNEPAFAAAENNNGDAAAFAKTNEPAIPVQTQQEHTVIEIETAAVQDAEKAIVPAENGSTRHEITQVFSDPNPLYSPGQEPAGVELVEEAIAPPADELTGPGNMEIPVESIHEGPEAGAQEEYAAPVPKTFPENDHTIETAAETILVQDTGEDNIETAIAEASTQTVTGTTAAENYTAEPSNEITAQKSDEDIIAEMPATETNKEEPVFIKTIIETPAAKNDLLFEPYYTVDYFASQGIKLSKMEAEGKDKLGRQLKSFTEWLKTMKKLPQVSIERILAENEESKVVEDAIHSLDNREVVTEAMAEVFEKQGMYEKATGIYQKLSLQNPAKSAYFAARIEALKH